MGLFIRCLEDFLSLKLCYDERYYTEMCMRDELICQKIGPMKLPSRIGGGTFDLFLYIFEKSGDNYFVLVKGDIVGEKNVLVRIDSNCVWADIFGSARCDCAEQLHEAMRRINKEGRGLLIHAYNQDGRGLSLRDHVLVYMEQDKGYDTIEADERCGFDNPDRRSYDEAIAIIRDFELSDIRLLTNNPHRISSLADAGITSVREAIEAATFDKFNIAQLYMKKKALGHLFDSFDLEDPKIKELFDESVKKWSHGEYDGHLWAC
jgi:3,4-dihydroxy 2-butanone 4-phosphate synthase/GTP cyclohydrolase II